MTMQGEVCIVTRRCSLWTLVFTLKNKIDYRKFIPTCSSKPFMIESLYYAMMKLTTFIISILTGCIIGILSMFLMYMWVPEHDHIDEGVDIMYFTLDDGQNLDEERGCFFVIRAGKGVDIDPSRYSFYVSQKGYRPQKLDFALREYNDTDPYGPVLTSGDRNGIYNYTLKGDLWSDGELIGFDMPMQNNPGRPMDVTIQTGIYEVMIMNDKGEHVFSDTFSYTRQGY